ncbi:MAG: SWIM zinc finger family protein [Pseudomonadota bacterium]|nr:SWIM zinc finger family protein [Pseudomonadota bacterium]
MPRRGNEWWERAPSRPRDVRGGIKARSKRGAFAETWWGQRWLAALESLDVGGRLQRGRSYARRGQVLDLTIAAGAVTARVQGSRPRPYSVSIGINTIAGTTRDKIGRALAGSLQIAAGLMAGEMPPEIEQACADAGLSLFPRRADQLVTRCSCPDWSNPCKHVAAVYYLLAEEFDRDPFLLFRLRGLEREDIVRLLEAVPATSVEQADPDDGHAEPLPTDPSVFWQGTPIPYDAVTPPAVAAPLARRLGAFPFWRGEEDFLDALVRTYQAATTRAIEICLATPISGGPSMPAGRDR